MVLDYYRDSSLTYTIISLTTNYMDIMCKMEDFEKLDLLPWYRNCVKTELDNWHKKYPSSKGTVLDLGAGCGETAYFYLKHGAQRVVCIESDPEAIKKLKINRKIMLREMPSRSIDIIEAKIDKIKIDAEGCEKDAIIEIHFPYNIKQIWQQTRDNYTIRIKKRELESRIARGSYTVDRFSKYFKGKQTDQNGK